jgi:hypothetical protein
LALKIEGILVGLDSRPAVPAKEDRREQEAHLRLDVYTGPGELLTVKAAPEFGKLFEEMLEGPVSLPVRGFAYPTDRGGADISYKYLPEQDKRATEARAAEGVK